MVGDSGIMLMAVLVIKNFSQKIFRQTLKILVVFAFGWAIMIVINSLLVHFSRVQVPVLSKTEAMVTGVQRSYSEPEPVVLRIAGNDFFTIGHLVLEKLSTNVNQQGEPLASQGEGTVFRYAYRCGIPFRSFEFQLIEEQSAYGLVTQSSGAFLIQGSYVPLMPNGMNVWVPYSAGNRPFLYLLNICAWTTVVYLIVIFNTKNRLRIRKMRLRAKAERQGLCPECGYELNGLIKCPECGAG